jgi:hypothetical protein
MTLQVEGVSGGLPDLTFWGRHQLLVSFLTPNCLLGRRLKLHRASRIEFVYILGQ